MPLKELTTRHAIRPNLAACGGRKLDRPTRTSNRRLCIHLPSCRWCFPFVLLLGNDPSHAARMAFASPRPCPTRSQSQRVLPSTGAVIWPPRTLLASHCTPVRVPEPGLAASRLMTRVATNLVLSLGTRHIGFVRVYPFTAGRTRIYTEQASQPRAPIYTPTLYPFHFPAFRRYLKQRPARLSPSWTPSTSSPSRLTRTRALIKLKHEASEKDGIEVSNVGYVFKSDRADSILRATFLRPTRVTSSTMPPISSLRCSRSTTILRSTLGPSVCGSSVSV